VTGRPGIRKAGRFREIARFVRTDPDGNQTEFVVLRTVKEE
jgi:hypothetical protein